MDLDFAQALELVSGLQSRGWRLGLDRMREFLDRAGLADKLGGAPGPQYVHVAGTNGKGSVTAFVQSILREQGWSVGATYSPYVYSVRERVQFSPAGSKGSPLVSRDEFAQLVAFLWPIAESLEATPLGGPTEFEFKTAMGFLHWSQKGADWVALEVGMGGRLDATNVVTPAASAIVSIGLDHTEHLGNSLGQIAVEKAGIIKEGRPVVTGDLDDEALLAVETIAKIQGAPLWKFGTDVVLSRGFDGFRVETPQGTFERLTPGMAGSVQPHNMAIAIAACVAAGAVRYPDRVRHGVSAASAPGRMQRTRFRGCDLLLDGAHNGDAARALVDSLSSVLGSAPRVCLLTGMLAGHRPADFYEPLATVAREAHFVPIDFHRSRKPTELMSEAGWLFEHSDEHGTLDEGLAACLESGADLILVTGSFYLVGEVGRLIGLADD